MEAGVMFIPVDDTSLRASAHRETSLTHISGTTTTDLRAAGSDSILPVNEPRAACPREMRRSQGCGTPGDVTDGDLSKRSEQKEWPAPQLYAPLQYLLRYVVGNGRAR